MVVLLILLIFLTVRSPFSPEMVLENYEDISMREARDNLKKF